jgi:hypothetical protein
VRDVSQIAGDILDDVGVVPGPGVSVLAHSLGSASQNTEREIAFRALLTDRGPELSLMAR